MFLLTESYSEVNDMQYGISVWDNGKYGNHRAVINVQQSADAVWVNIPWRRRDSDPDKKNIIIVKADTEEQIKNLIPVNINNEYGDLVFQAETPGKYYVYYMPWEVSGWKSFPKITYPPFKMEADEEWLSRNKLTPETLSDGYWRNLPKADVLEIQACDEFHRFDPMEVIATKDEVEQLIAKYPDRPYLLFPESRTYPVKMTNYLPLRWIKTGSKTDFFGEAQIGEFYTFQIGIYPFKQDLENIEVDFTDLKGSIGQVVNASEFRCFNLGGIDWLGRPFKRSFSITKGKVGTLWFGVQIPKDATIGYYESIISIKPSKAPESQIKLYLNIVPNILEDGGESDLWRFSRLKWLDSTIGIDDDITDPYTPIEVSDQIVKCLGRNVRFDETGLLQSIVSNGNEILAEPMKFIVDNKETAKTVKKPANINKHTKGSAEWESEYVQGNFTVKCNAKMDYDGYINFKISLSTDQDIKVNDIRLDIPIKKEFATYMMGMGHKGGYRSKEWRWKWDRNLHQDCVWIGDVDAGLQCKLKGPNYTWPLVNIHYKVKPLDIPEAWYNEGKGGCDIVEADDKVIIRAYSGEREIQAGQELRFDFGLLITPVKPLDLAKHSKERYYHAYHPIDRVVESGANVVNIHHANELNPYINYPFFAVDKLKDYVKEGHDKGLKVKIYYTLRELSNHVVELPALLNIGDEIFVKGAGGGYSWLQEHLVSDYSPAWHHWFSDVDVDSALVTAGLSRWHNYYLEGLRWLLEHVQIDGLYIDDIGYDREIMKRTRKVLDRYREGCLIDVHSWNHFNDMAGWANCLNMYMEHLPYVDSLWIGEGFDYNESPEYWLVEISGIPFGLFSEMLEGGGNQWRGMIYGMTTRFPYSGDPRPIWKIWDDFGIQDAKMIGYWDKSCPVKTDNKDILATAYVKNNDMLIAIASWAKEPVDCKLEIDWDSLNIDRQKAKIYAPAIANFQEEATFQLSDRINVQPGRGWLLKITY